METFLQKLLKSYRKEQDEKYTQAKSRQGRDADGNRKRKAEQSSGAASAAAAPPTRAGKSPGGKAGVKKMRLVLSRPGAGKIGVAMDQPSADAASVARTDNEYDL